MSNEVEEKIYNPSLAAKKQKEFCKENGYPHFAPETGRCWKCSRNIYEPYEHKHSGHITGITVEEATNELVTGCPHCYKSYCD